MYIKTLTTKVKIFFKTVSMIEAISSLRFQIIVCQNITIFRRGKKLINAFPINGISKLLSQIPFITIVFKMSVCNVCQGSEKRAQRTYDDLSHFFVIYLVHTTFCRTIFIENM
jgi:hypothetical protein